MYPQSIKKKSAHFLYFFYFKHCKKNIESSFSVDLLCGYIRVNRPTDPPPLSN